MSQAAGYLASPQQRSAWIAQEGVSNPLYAQIALLPQDVVDAKQIEDALRNAIRRHEIFRTAFHRQPGLKVPFQVILDECPASVRTLSLSTQPAAGEILKLMQDEAAVPFDFEHGPLLRVLLANAGANWQLLILTGSALCCDSQSLRLLSEEILSRFDGTYRATADALRYVQFSQWQNDLLEGEDDSAKQGKAFWADRLQKAAERLALPLEKSSSGPMRFEQVEYSLPSESLIKAQHLATEFHSSMDVIFLSVWQILLYRLTGKAEFVVRVVASGRDYEELVEALGPIAKALPVAAHIETDFQFGEVVRRSRDAVADATSWQEYFDPSRDSGAEPGVAFEFRSLLGSKEVTGVRRTVVYENAIVGASKMTLSCLQGVSSVDLRLSFDAARFSRKDVERMLGHFNVLLTAALSSPQCAISKLPLLSNAERQQLVVDWNRTESAYPECCLQELFEQQAARVPEDPATRCDDTVLSYRELNERANRLAHHLRKLGVRPDQLVALFLNRSTDMMIAVLAIMKAGGAYVPLNTDNPKSRLEQQLNGVAVLITQAELKDAAPSFSGPVVCVDSDANQWADEPGSNPEQVTKPDNLAYVIYTSGSTGVPKGVAVRHRNLVNYAHHISKVLHLDSRADALHFATVSTLGADLGNTCIYPSLISGGCLHILPYEVATDAHHMAVYQQRYKVDVLKIVPSQLAALLNSPEGGNILPRKFLITGGETLSRNVVEKIRASGAQCEVINHYGPTETTVGSLMRELKDFDWQACYSTSIPIGRPLANTRIYVLDSLGQPVPIGVAGELYIAGTGVTAGYLNQPERTAERFVPDPFSSDPQSRMYRTGDLVRYLDDGNIEFLGRVDDQVKVRGFRIELGEIESVLLSQQGVKQAFVLAREENGQEKQLAAYVVADREAGVTGQQLRETLRSRLPDYMIPSSLMILDRLPLTSNGKIDRNALPKPGSNEKQKPYIAPQTPTEEALAGIWMELLRTPQISSDDNFFDLGGHSLSGTQVISRVREKFRVEVALRTLFEKPTLSGLAAAVDGAKETSESPNGPIQRVSRDSYRQAAKKR
jgi:amino acid adenylation domain-containing protein